MIQTATTLEQSRKLLSLGINPETADMAYVGGWNDSPCNIPYKMCLLEDTPAWSLSAILAILPDSIEAYGQYDDGYIVHLKIEKVCGKWWVGYGDTYYRLNTDPFAACIDLIEQLVRKGYINIKKKQQ